MQEGQQLGPFIIEKALGSGAMGAVYRARYTKTGRQVAVKVMGLGMVANANALARFEREAEILKQLNHPNVVRFFGHGKSQGTPYYAMEYIEGESLDRVMARRGRMSWEEVVALGKQLCSALQSVHEKGIIHRDLKPSNLMMLRDGTVKLTDFGIAKDTDVTALTAANCTVGTAAYMSPEQCRGDRDLSFKSDLYSLGVLFFELLTGQKPFQAETPMDMFLLHLQAQPVRPSKLVMDTPVWLNTLILQLLEKKPEHRPRDAAMVGQALERVEEKVQAQQSAGVDAAKARAVDRAPGEGKVAQGDKEVAQVLRKGGKKRSKKKKGTPLYRTVWFQIPAVLVVLAALGVALWWVMRPPSLESLAEEAQKLLSSRKPEDWDSANADGSTVGPLTKFYRYYGARGDDLANQVRDWAEGLGMAQEEDALHRRIEGKMHNTPDNKAEELAFAAIDLEKKGELDQARAKWQELAALPESSPNLKNLAQRKRLKHLEAIETWVPLLKKNFDQFRTHQLQPATEGQRLAVEALRYENLGDFAAARVRWLELQKKNEAKRPPRMPPKQAPPEVQQAYEQDREQWLWGLVAARKARELENNQPADPSVARKDNLTKQLQTMREMQENKQTPQARMLCQDIVDLYPRDAYPDLQGLVQQARDALPGLMP
jgi:eukaryotic-like serine/threonine-protein kinase